MNSLELTRIGIILTMISVFLISPEVFYRARELTWVNNIFEWTKSFITNIRGATIEHINKTHRSEVKRQLGKSLKSGKPAKLLIRLTLVNLIPLISLITLILYIYYHLHVSVGITAGIFIGFFFLMGVVDVFEAHRIDKQKGEVVSFITKATEYIMVPPIFYLFFCLRGLLWSVVIFAILVSSKSVRSWLAIIGILIFLVGQTLQLVATYI